MLTFEPKSLLRPSSHRILLLLALITSCFQGARAPSVQARGILAPGNDEAAGKLEGAFDVVFGSPRGEVADPSEISLVFNRPMRPLELAGEESHAPVSIDPPVKGAFRWVGTNALLFAPEDHLPRATDFKVTVPAGTRALDGSQLAKAYELRFATAPPSIVRSEPGDRSNHLSPQSKFLLRWNQPVADAEIARAVKLHAGAAANVSIPFAVRHPDSANALLTEIAPKSPLPKDSAIQIVVGADLRGTEGPRPSGKEQTLSFETYGPLKVNEVECSHDTPHGKCAAGSEVSLRLSNAVKIKDLRRAVVIDPPVSLKWSSRSEDDDTTNWLTLDGRFGPARTFTVRLRSSIATPGGGKSPLRDEYGQALAQDWVGKVEFDDFWPTAEIGVQGVYLEASEKRDIPVLAVNVREMRIVSKALKPDEVFEFGPYETRRENGFDRIVRLGVSPTTVRPAAAKNSAARVWVHGDDVLGGKSRRGPIAAAVSYIERPGTPAQREAWVTRIVQVTDLGISAKLSDQGTLVWVTRLSSGAPVAGATVEIKRPPRGDATTSGSFQTDGDGFATIPKEKFVPRDRETAIIFVRTSDDWAYRHVTDTLSGWRFGASIESGGDEAPIGMVFTERGLYRPGDTVKVKGIVREARPRGTATPTGKEVHVALKGPDGETINDYNAKLSGFGTFAFDVKVPESGKLGSYLLATNIGALQNDWGEIRGSFEVAEYRPAEFKVGVDAVFRPGAAGARASSYVRGDKGNWSISGDFLFGAPMSKADVRYTITRAPVGFSPPMPEGFLTGERAYTVDLPEASPRSYEVQNGRAQLDDKGRLVVSAPLAMPGQLEPERVSAEVEITDISRQSLSGNSATLVHPGEFYIALKPGVDFFAKPNVAAQPEVLTVDPDGAKRGQVTVHLDLVRRNFSLARQANGGSSLHSVVTAVDKIAASCDVVTKETPVSCPLTPSASGYYVLHATAKDKRGNKVGAATSFYVIGDGEVGWGDNDEKRVELVPDHTTYESGQTAHVLVKSPFKSADALVTVERAGIYSRRHVTLSGPTPTIDVPISDDLRPNAFVSVLLVRGRTKAAPTEGTDPDVGAPTFRAGYTMLSINPESRRLKVLVKANKDKFLPGEKVDVDVDVRDHKAKAAKSEVTLYAVDEGVLSLVAYKTPDPIPVFSAPRPLKVSTVESRDAMAQVKLGASALAMLGLDKGLDGGGGGEAMRRDFRQSVYFNPSLVTDAKGHVHASFTLPDSLTTYRIMAVAVAEDDRFGSADTPIVASKPLMARPAFPLVLRAGDSIEAGIVLTSKGLAKTKVDVTAATEGLTLVSPAKKTIDLDSNASVEVRFSFKAEHAVKAKVSFRASGGGAADSVEIARTVLSPAVTEAVALYGDTTGTAGEKIGDLSSMRDDVGGLELSVSSTALVGLAGGVEQLIEYPYGCTEQLTSRLVPMLPLRDLARDFHLSLPADVDATVAKTVALILGNQRSDGGFGLFPDSRQSLPWVTAYALWGLGEARRRGATVPESSLEQATRYVQRELAGWDRDRMSAATAAFVVDVLAANGSPDVAWTNRLFEDRKKLPLFGEAMLLHAMATSKGDAKAMKELIREIDGHIRLDGPVARAVDNAGDTYAALMDSETRTTALVLRGLLAAAPSHPMAARIAKGLLADRKGGTWRSTQETAWALLSLDDYRRAQEKSEPSFDVRAFLGNAEILTAGFHGRTAASTTGSLPAARVLANSGSTLAFELDGSGRLFYEARLRYAKKELPAQPLDRGFFVKKTMRTVRPEELATAVKTIPTRSLSTFGGGDLVLADLVVVTPSPREFVVVDDPLPAGLEPVDVRLATTGASLDIESAGEPATDEDYDGRDDRLATGTEYLSSWPRREMRDDRVLIFVEHMAAGMYHYRYLARATTFGTFVVPPTKAEEMYVPEVFGRSGAITVDVKGKAP